MGPGTARSFTKSVEHIGRIDELRLSIWTFGLFNIREMLKLMPVGVRALLKGKLPPIFHKSNPGQENVRRIFEKVEKQR